VLASLRGDHARLGYAVQLATVRCLSTFRENPTDVPIALVSTLAQQHAITPTDHLERPTARHAHGSQNMATPTRW
jgi:hypothetical protein